MKIIQSNKSFSTDRFVILMKADFSTHKSNYLKLAIGAAGIFTAISLLISFFTVIDINNIKNTSEMIGSFTDGAIKSRQNTGGMTYIVISMWVFSLGLTVLGSLTFSNLSSKRSRISAFMIPASRTEKFILRLLCYLVGGTVILAIGFLFGLLICQIAFGGASAAWVDFSKFFSEDYAFPITFAFFLMALLGNSLYALGSSFWPRLSWIKTWVVILIVQWIGAIILMVASAAHINWYEFFHFVDFNISFFKWSGLTLLTVLNIVCWILAWYRYKNTQIVQRFMTK